MRLIKVGDRNEDARALQKALNKELGLRLSNDGDFGPNSAAGLSRWQQDNGFTENDQTGLAMFGQKSNEVFSSYIESNFITENAYAQVAKTLNVEVAALKAFALTESRGRGFFDNGFPVILFERHKFYQALTMKFGARRAAAVLASDPDICNPNSGGYVGNEGEIPRLERAANIDWTCAHASASWGAFQLMGFNYRTCGYVSLTSFIDAMKANEIEHLNGLSFFIMNKATLLRAIQNRDWGAVAANYNGTGAVSVYGPKLEGNYKKALSQT